MRVSDLRSRWESGSLVRDGSLRALRKVKQVPRENIYMRSQYIVNIKKHFSSRYFTIILHSYIVYFLRKKKEKQGTYFARYTRPQLRIL